MREYSLSEQLALLVLDGQDSGHSTVAKKAAVLSIAAAEILQGFVEAGGEDYLLSSKAEFSKKIQAVKKMNRKERRALELKMADKLAEAGVLWEIPNLLGCDMNYYTAEITMREYKADEVEYLRIVESIRAEVLEPGEVTLEMVSMLWLLRESGAMHDIFSVDEQNWIEQKLVALKTENEAYRVILNAEFHSAARNGYLGFLRWKQNAFKNPYMEGVNLAFPFLDRKQAVFIDMVVLGTSVEDRRKATIDFLRKYGHTCEEVKNGTETLVKIDNRYYRIWPTVRTYKLPVQGVELQPVYK